MSEDRRFGVEIDRTTDCVVVTVTTQTGNRFSRVLSHDEFETLRKRRSTWAAWIRQQSDEELCSPIASRARIERKTRTVTVAASVIVAISIVLGFFFPRGPSSEFDARDLRAMEWFSRQDAAEIHVIEEYFERAGAWDLSLARSSIRRSIEWAGSVDVETKGRAVKLARKLLKRFTMEEIDEQINSDPRTTAEERAELMRRARTLING